MTGESRSLRRPSPSAAPGERPAHRGDETAAPDPARTGQVSADAAIAYERLFVPALFAPWAPIVADAAGIAPGQRVLDVGCGTGILAREAAARVGPTGRVAGLDLNGGMLAVARQLRPDLDWREGDAARLPFGDGDFDAVVSQFALMFFPDPTAALAEMWRALGRPGRLAVAVWGPLERAPGYARLARIVRRHAGAEAARAIEAPFALGSETDLLRLFGAAGIAGARSELRDGHARFASVDALVLAELKGWVLADAVDDERHRGIADEARAELADFGDGSGVAVPVAAIVVTARKA